MHHLGAFEKCTINPTSLPLHLLPISLNKVKQRVYSVYFLLSLKSLNLNQFNHTSQINKRISMLNSLTARNNRNSNSESTTSTIHRPLLTTPSSTLKLQTRIEYESTNKILKRVNEINSRALNIESNSSSTQAATNNAEKIVTTSSNFTALLANLNKNTQTTEHTSAKLAHLSSTQLSTPSESSLLSKAIEPQPTGATASANTWINIKSHTNQCNIIQRKSRRKRSKSLPSSFNIDSLLDYLNCSMILNKHELKKLNHQRNLLMNSSSLSSYSLKNRHRHLLTGGTSSYYQHSSGYNSENHSNSSNSTSVHNFQTNSTSNLNNNYYNPSQLNFYRLSIFHLPLHFVHSQCTCGAANINNSVISSVGSDLSLLTAGSNNRRLSSKVLSSSPNLKNDLEYEEEEEVRMPSYIYIYIDIEINLDTNNVTMVTLTHYLVIFQISTNSFIKTVTMTTEIISSTWLGTPFSAWQLLYQFVYLFFNNRTTKMRN